MRHCARLAALGLLPALAVAALSAQNTANDVYDRVILGGHVMDPATGLDAVRNLGLLDGRIAVITTQAVGGVIVVRRRRANTRADASQK